MPTTIPSTQDVARQRLRELLGETARASSWDANRLDRLLGAATSLEDAAYHGWLEKAAEYSELVDTSDSGKSMRFSGLLTNAMKMVEHFNEQRSAATSPSGPRGSMTRLIKRP